MTRKDKYEHAKFIIGRYDHYNDAVNNKGAFYIGLNTFLLGGLCVGFVTIHKEIEKPQFLWWLAIAFGLLSILSIVLTIFAINPYLSSGNKDSKKRSLIFFGSVSEYQKENYIKTFLVQDEDRMTDDIINQAWLLSKGLTQKYKSLRIAGWMLIIQFFLLIPIIYSITKNLLQNEHL
jgi:hypothetical protein